MTAYHEAGHAILLATLEHTDPLHKVTIIPRGPYLGAAFHLPIEDKYHFHKQQGKEELIVTMVGGPQRRAGFQPTEHHVWFFLSESPGCAPGRVQE